MKRALCVGINDYPIAGSDLKGCVNDARAWAGVLRSQYDFARSDITLVLDKHATHDRMVKELKGLLAGARSGDVLVFTNSSHGTYLADTGAGGEEPDRYDEAMCPWDCKQQLLVDDELRELFADLPRGVRLTVVSDSCHSGSVTRVVVPGMTPDDRRVRFLSPKKVRKPVIEGVRQRARSTHAEMYPESSMKELLLSGCRSDQYSYDALIDGKYQGAMTHFALAVMAAHGYRLSYARLARELRQALADARYDQEPQLEGRPSFKRRQVFT